MKLKEKITIVTLATVFVIFVIAMITNTMIFYKEAKEFRNSEIISSFEYILNEVNHATNSTESIVCSRDDYRCRIEHMQLIPASPRLKYNLLCKN